MDKQTKDITVKFDSSQVSYSSIVETLNDAGFDAGDYMADLSSNFAACCVNDNEEEEDDSTASAASNLDEFDIDSDLDLDELAGSDQSEDIDLEDLKIEDEN